MPKNSDYKQYSKVILDELFRGRGCDELFAVGKTKILMRNELVGLLEKAKAKAVSIDKWF
jgi:myosin heavy subunit